MSYIRYHQALETDIAMAAIPTFSSPSAVDELSPGAPAFSPLYSQIKALILQSLQAGEWKPGEAIPSEIDLASRYGVSQGTVRKAIDELAAENLVIRRQGKGTFVATHAARQVQTRFLRLVPDQADPSTGNSDTYSANGKDILVDRTITACSRERATKELQRASRKPRERRIASAPRRTDECRTRWLPTAYTWLSQ